MDRKELEIQMKNANPVDWNFLPSIINQSNETYTHVRAAYGRMNQIITIEECSELIAELQEWLLGNGCRLGVLEELCDVIICVLMVKDIVNVSNVAVRKACLQKLDTRFDGEPDSGKDMIEAAVLKRMEQENVSQTETILLATLSLSQFQQAVSKGIRKENFVETREQTVKWMAEAIITIYRLKKLFGFQPEEIEKMLQIKSGRILERMKQERGRF